MNETQLIEAIKAAAEQSGLSQKQIAEKTGTQQPNISKYLNGNRMPELDTFIKLAEAVGLEIVIKPVKSKKALRRVP